MHAFRLPAPSLLAHRSSGAGSTAGWLLLVQCDARRGVGELSNRSTITRDRRRVVQPCHRNRRLAMMLTSYAYWHTHHGYDFWLRDGAVADFRGSGGTNLSLFLLED